MARAALALLDDVGLPDLTMRRLAAALDVQPSALYHHFPNKQAMLAELADRIVTARPSAVPHERGGGQADATWATGVRDAAGTLRDSLLAYRDGAEVVASTLSMGLGANAARDRLASAIARGGFDTGATRLAATALLHFVLGHVSHEQQRLQFDSLGVVSPDAVDDAAVDGFLFGVDVFIAGLRARATVPSV